MNSVIIALLTIVIVIALLVMLYITLYNKIQFSKIRVDEAEKVIIEEIHTRYEIIENCQKIIKKATKMEIDVFDEVNKMVKSNVSSYELEKEITKVIATIRVIKEDYPKLEEKKEFKEYLRKLEESDTKITAAKNFYNRNNSKLVALIKAFPSNIIALIHGIKIQPFYDAKELFNEIDDGIKI